MQTKSAIILGLSFVIATAIFTAAYYQTNKKSDQSAYERASISATANRKVTVKAGEQPSNELLAELSKEAKEKAEVIAAATGQRVTKTINIYMNSFSQDEYYGRQEENQEGEKTSIYEIAVTFSGEII
ncbi:MAG: hypothetical protein LBC09_07595 [Helicobacteraceae bacterium]|jgi:hypothetical protein|nr:hypothetical protein [Helicobacteraceae bacterium]